MISELWNQLLRIVFSIEFPVVILALIGIYALLWWCIDNFKSIVQIIRSFLVPYFQPNEDQPLSEKFGNWAGNVKDINLTNWELILKKMERNI